MLDDNYIKTLVEKTAEFGKGKIHIIVNNAGYTWDGVIHKVNLLRFLHLSIARGTTKLTAYPDDRQAMGKSKIIFLVNYN